MKKHPVRVKADDVTKGGSMPSSFEHFERYAKQAVTEAGKPPEKRWQQDQKHVEEFTNPTRLLSHWYAALIKRINASLATLPDAESAESEQFSIPQWKRILDLTLIAFSTPIWLPVMIGIMIFIKLSSPGPVFYRQERIGHGRKRFQIYKFRSMRVNAETVSHESYFESLMRSDAPMAKLDAADDRIIPGGRFLRASGLDELPQLFNVIWGNMSLVGPRPCTLREFIKYEPWQHERFNAPPGLTGYWQVNGKNQTTFVEMINLDIHYAHEMSVRLDFWIILRTFPTLLRQLARLKANHHDKAASRSEAPPVSRITAAPTIL